MSGILETQHHLAMTVPNDYVPTTLSGVPAAPTANDFGERVVTVGTTHTAMIMPVSWRGRYIRIHNTHATGTMSVAASLSATAEVDNSAAAAVATTFTATSSTSKAGLQIPGVDHAPRNLVEVYVPKWDPQQTAYLIVEASTSLTARIGLGRGTPG
jgi:hypothetical protein